MVPLEQSRDGLSDRGPSRGAEEGGMSFSRQMTHPQDVWCVGLGMVGYGGLIRLF